MSISTIEKIIRKNDANQERGFDDMQKALDGFDEKQALKHGMKYLKDFVDKKLKSVIISNGKRAFGK